MAKHSGEAGPKSKIRHRKIPIIFAVTINYRHENEGYEKKRGARPLVVHEQTNNVYEPKTLSPESQRPKNLK